MTEAGAGAPQRLDVALVQRGLVRSRSQAAVLVKEGRVTVDGSPVVKPSVLVGADSVLVTDLADEWVSRGALKLVAALDGFGLDPRGLVCLDAGASTGGFSQVLLARGASRVIAVDVGHGQLSPVLGPEVRGGRLVSLEGVNVRELAPGAFDRWLASGQQGEVSGTPGMPGEQPGGAGIGLVVADLSFISLRLVLPALRGVAPAAELVVLVKPQFEVGRGGVREGIVRDPALRIDAVNGVLWAAHDAGLRVAGLIRSPIVGTHGNVELLARLSPSVGGNPSEWSDTVNRLAGA